MSNVEKDVENFVTDILKEIGEIIKGIFVGFYWGLKNLKNKGNLIMFLLCFTVPILGVLMKHKILLLKVPVYIKYFLYYVLLFFPLIFLIILGKILNNKKEKYVKIFKDIEFKGRDNKYPYLCDLKKDGKKIIYIFHSNIPLVEWQNTKTRLETSFDCNILLIAPGSNKKTVRLTTVPSDFKIPERIDWDDKYLQKEDGTITIGQGALDPICFNLNRVPHVLAAGETGSGKSVILRTCLWQMINQGARVYMIDFKGGVEFGKRYEQYGEVVTDRLRAVELFEYLVAENAERLKLFRDLEVKNLGEYNRKSGKKLCRVGVFCDEIAEMLDKKGVAKEEKQIYEKLEGLISTLARLSRATGINLFLGVQRPDANVLTGQIKNNIPVRISGRFADKTASEIVLGNTAAVELPDIKGRFLYKVGNEIIEFQSYYFDDDTMLKEIFVEVGAMLTEKEPEVLKKEDLCAPKVHPPIQKQAKPDVKTQKVVEKDVSHEKIRKPTRAELKKAEKEVAEMAAMDEYDLNLNFDDWGM